MVETTQAELWSALSGLDGAVVLGVLALATLVGLVARKPTSARALFLADRRLPAWAVGASIAATELSTLALVGVTYAVYRPGGSFACLQLVVIGSLLARVLVGWRVLPLFFEREIASPYEWLGQRLGTGVARLATLTFALGATLACVARLYLAVVTLRAFAPGLFEWLEARVALSPVVPPLACLCALAIAWTCTRGIARVVWTDVVLLCVTLAAALGVLLVIVVQLDTGWARLFQVAIDSHKLRLFDFSLSPGRAHTFWAAAIASTWGGIGAYALDQTIAQRLLCCADLRSARRALALSTLSVIACLLLALVGAGLFAYYERHPLSGAAQSFYAQRGDHILAIFAVQKLPAGLRGLLVASILAAALSGLGALLPALGQSLFAASGSSVRGGAGSAADAERASLRSARRALLAAGLFVCAVALTLERVSRRYGSLLELSATMTAYTQGALLAGFLFAALLRRDDGRAWGSAWGSGWLWSAPLSIMSVFAIAWHGPRSIWVCSAFAAAFLASWIAVRVLPGVRASSARAQLVRQTCALALALLVLVWINRYALIPVELGRRGDPEYRWLPLALPWYVPIGSTIAFVFGHLLARPAAREHALVAPGVARAAITE